MAKPPPGAPAGKTENVLQRLHKELFDRKQLDEYGVLGLKPGADDAAIRGAYLELSKLFHPHRYARFDSAEHKRVAMELYVLVQRAYTRLSGSARMPNHDGVERKRATKRSARDQLDRAISEAVTLLQENAHGEAIAMLSEVLSQDPERAAARLWLMVAGGRLALVQGDRAKALECFRAVLELQPSHVEARDKVTELSVPEKEPEKPGLFGRLFGRKG
jgi:tetratricopeptide (TPR) repeat protein